MNLSIEIEDEAWTACPDLEGLARQCIEAAAVGASFDGRNAEVALLFTDDASIAGINAEWREIAKPTNVLSFPAPQDMPIPEGEPRPLGDIVLASGVVAREAEEQGKSLRDHTAHLIIHGMLHLLGHDHEEDGEAEDMERLEISILNGLGIANPYDRH